MKSATHEATRAVATTEGGAALLDRICVTAAEGAQLLGISERYFHLLRHRENFPRGRSLGRAVRWAPHLLRDWFLTLPTAEQRDEPPQLKSRRFRSGIEVASPRVGSGSALSGLRKSGKLRESNPDQGS
jgi:predicted DNA-binding transcriptional regulator AlpA